jgi:hypothetical protein
LAEAEAAEAAMHQVTQAAAEAEDKLFVDLLISHLLQQAQMYLLQLAEAADQFLETIILMVAMVVTQHLEHF